jgi:hypothetical protein
MRSNIYISRVLHSETRRRSCHFKQRIGPAYEGAKQVRVHLAIPRPNAGGEPWKPRWGLETVVQRIIDTLGPEFGEKLFVSDLLDAEQLTQLANIRRGQAPDQRQP